MMIGHVAMSLIPIVLLLAPYLIICWIIHRSITALAFCSSSAAAGSTTTTKSETTNTTHTMPKLHVLFSTPTTTGLLLAVCLFHLSTEHNNNNNNNNSTTTASGLHDLIKGTDPLLNEILRLVPSIQKGPTPPLFFRNRHLQFIPWLIQNELHRLEGIPFQRIDIEVMACADKSEGPDCIPSLHLNDTVTLDIFPPFDNDDNDNDHHPNFNRSSPIILFAPGLRCYSQDLPGQMIMRRAYAEGFRSVVINRRGHTPGMPLKSPRWNLFGDIDDMEQVYWHLKENLVDQYTPMFLHGISSGTAVTVTALSAWDKRRTAGGKAPSFVASIAVTPGYDISKVMTPERFLFPYNDILTPLVKSHFVLQNEDLLRAYNSEAVDATLAATSLQEFVDAAAPFAGYPNATAYYRGENPINELRVITTPKFVLNAIDDPCCHINNLYEASPYVHHDGFTFAEMVSQTDRALLAVTKTGSHCPFLDGFFLPITKDPLYGGWMLASWADQVSIEYYRAALEVYGDRR